MSRGITGAKARRWSPVAPDPALPFGGGAVMASNAGQTVEGDDPHTALMRSLNFFPTPPWAARAGGELIRWLDPEARSAWEPACGEGHMALPLEAYFVEGVWRTDIHPHIGAGGPEQVGDFTAGDFDGPHDRLIDWVVSNPPFSHAEAFVEKGLQVARRGVAMLCRLAFVESVGRHGLMTRKAVSAPFAERVPMRLGSWDPDLTSATAYAWFVWLQPAALAVSPAKAAIGAAWSIGATLERIIPPGTKARLTQADDRIVFAGEEPLEPPAQMDLLGASA